MKIRFSRLASALPFVLALNATAVTRYVDLNSPTPTPPYTNWLTAATIIQDAIDAAASWDEIVVTNGIYETGGKALISDYTNRIAVTLSLTIRSVNGPAVTVIRGVPGIGASAVKCAYLSEGSTLSGFTLADGGTRRYSFPSSILAYWGGGAFCVSGAEVLTNCIITGCGADRAAGGVYSGTLIDCDISGNYAYDQGGGVYRSSLTRCKLTSNWSSYGGGAASAVLSDCVLSNNIADLRGGGAYQSSLERCSVTGSSAWWGGGVHECTVNNSLMVGNSAHEGGGSRDSTLVNCALINNVSGSVGGGALRGSLVNCTVTGNSAGAGGGTYQSAADNCIVYFNTATADSNFSGGTLNWSCTMPLPSGGTNNFTTDPQLADNFHLTYGSFCLSAGTSALTTGEDIDEEAWLNPPAVGCDQFYSGGATGALTLTLRASYTNVAAGFPVSFTAVIEGHATSNQWDFGDGTVVVNRPGASHVWSNAGEFVVVLTAYNDSFPDGVSTMMTVLVGPAFLHVALGSTNPVVPYSGWATAASNIQDAIDAGFVGSTVLVSNGVYAVGERVVGSSSSNRVVIPSLRTVQSVNGPAVTVIQGHQVPGTTNGASAVRCVWLAPNATLSGFTLTNGATATDFDETEEPWGPRNGGGAIYGEDATAVVWNCVLAGNASAYFGGASFGGTLNQCLINGNWTGGEGGGAYSSILNNCCLFNNEATGYGGGALYSTLNNCTVTANFPSGVEVCTANNCIVFGNSPANHESIYGPSTLNFCCTSPLTDGGTGNITNAPAFVDPAIHDYRLQSNSPCINSGDTSFAPTNPDLDGNPRISGGTVDIGAYEFQPPGSVLSYAWAQQYGVPTDGTADFVDTDGDGGDNYHEWRSDTIPTNSASALRMASVTNGSTGLEVTWESVPTRSYWLEREEDLGGTPAFQTIATNIPGVAGTKTFNDTTATNGGPYFYRVGVQ